MPSIYDRIRLPDKAGKRHINAGEPGILVAGRDNLANFPWMPREFPRVVDQP